MDVCEDRLLPNRDIPHVKRFIHNLRVYVKLKRVAKAASQPEAGHKYDDVVSRVGSCKVFELPAARLIRVVYIVCIVLYII